MSINVVLVQMAMIVILMGVGYTCYKTGLVKSDAKKVLSALVINVFNPAITVNSMIGNTGIKGSDVIITAIAGAGMYGGLILCGMIFGRLYSKDVVDQRIRHLMYVFPNTGFIGIPVAKAVLGDEALMYVAIINLEFNLLFYTYGYLQAMKDGEKFSFASLKSMINVGTVTSLIGLVIFAFKIPVHSIITQSLTYLGNATTPLAMLIVGITMAEQAHFLDIFKNVRLYPFCVIRMIGIPLASAVLLKMLPISAEICQVILLMVSMPNANTPLMLLTDKGIRSRDCSDGIIITTLMSVLTIPLAVMVYLYL